MVRKLGKYSILEKLGEGSMGTVYEAHDNILDRSVAIKIMAGEIQRNPELKLRFYREAKAAAGLHHNNIVTVHDLGEEGDVTYIVMELLKGKNLKDIIRDQIPLSLEKKLLIMAQTADGLSCAHKNGFIHRDIKPGNIFVTDSGTVKILDFGIARMPQSDLTRVGQRLGTPVYMSPEQVKGAKLDERSDIFSAGIVFYELLTWVHPFRDKDISKSMENILLQNQFPFKEQFPDAPTGLWPILNTCLAKEPNGRFPSMADLHQSCCRLMEDVNLASKKIAEELAAALSGLRQASESANAPAKLIQLHQEMRDILKQIEKADYISLSRLKSALAAEPFLRETSPELQGKQSIPKLQDSTGSTSDAQASSSAEPSPAEQVVPDHKPLSILPAQPPATQSEDELRGNEMLAQAKALLAEDQLDQALGFLRRAIGLLGPKDSLVQMLVETRRKIDERNRGRVSLLLGEARETIAAKQFVKTNEILDQLLALEPNNPEVLELQRMALAEIEVDKSRQANKEEGEKAKNSGFKLLAERKFREGLQAFARAAELLGEDTAIRLGKDEAEKELREETLQSEVRSGLEEAQRLFRCGVLDQARIRANDVLMRSPSNAEATDLLLQIDRARQDEEKRNAIALLRSQSEQALNQKDFAEALSLADKALQRDFSDAQIQNLIQRINKEREENRRQEAVARLVAQAKELLTRQDFTRAEALVREALTIIPEHAAGLECLRVIAQIREDTKRSDRIASLLAQGRQELTRGDFQKAERCAREVLQVDTQNVGATDLLSEIRHTHEEHKKAQIESILSRSREALTHGQFEYALSAANEIFALDAKHKGAKALIKGIKSAAREKEKEERKRQKESRRLSEANLSPEKKTGEIGTLDETVLLKKEKRRSPGWIWIAVAAIAFIIIGVTAVKIYRVPHETKPVDYSAQIAQARSYLDQRNYDQAIAILQKIQAVTPVNGQVKAMLATAQNAKQQTRIEELLMEAQYQRSQNQPDESLKIIQQILVLSPDHPPAVALRSEIERETADARSKTERDNVIQKQLAALQSVLTACKLREARAEMDKVRGEPSVIQNRLANVRSLLTDCKLDAVKAEIDKIAATSPDAAGLAALRKKLAARTAEMVGIQEEMSRQSDIAYKLEKTNELRSRADQLFRQGKYNDCESVLNQIAAESPNSQASQSLRARVNEAVASSNAFEAAIEAKQRVNAGQAISRLEKANPDDPSLPEFRRRLEAIQKSGKAVLSIYRLDEPAVITLDGERIGTDGEVIRFDISPGVHTIVVQNNSGKKSSKTEDFSDGLDVTYVYNSATLDLRFMTEADRALRKNIKQREEVHHFQVEHPHGGMFNKILKGSCSGELLISGLQIEYKPSQGNDRFSAQFSKLILKLSAEKLEFFETNQSKPFQTLRARSSEEARKIKELWDSLERLGK
jgi:serine/threonine protein kinase